MDSNTTLMLMMSVAYVLVIIVGIFLIGRSIAKKQHKNVKEVVVRSSGSRYDKEKNREEKNRIKEIGDRDPAVAEKPKDQDSGPAMLSIFSPFSNRRSKKPKRATTSKVQFSAVAPAEVSSEKYSVINIMMYEESFRSAVEEVIHHYEKSPATETKSGILQVEDATDVKVILKAAEFEIDDSVQIQRWCGGYLNFPYAFRLPKDFDEADILFTADIYFNEIPATKLKFVVDVASPKRQTPPLVRIDIMSAFVSYASQDRARVATVIQGMQKARPELDIFFDVESLRSGEDWEGILKSEILKRDILFLCWSRNAKESKWVNFEWKFAASNKGVESIEPIPLEPPDICAPPSELSNKHFNDKLLFIINDGQQR